MNLTEEIIEKLKAQYGTTDPSLSQNLNTIERVEKAKQERKWAAAKKKLVSKTPLDWFEIAIKEWLNSGKQGTKTFSELLHWHFVRDYGDYYEVDKMMPFENEYELTIRANKKETFKSQVLLHNKKTSQLFSFPDWDSMKARAQDEKKKNKVSLKVKGEKGAKND